jgi:hypothetical protein
MGIQEIVLDSRLCGNDERAIILDIFLLTTENTEFTEKKLYFWGSSVLSVVTIPQFFNNDQPLLSASDGLTLAAFLAG